MEIFYDIFLAPWEKPYNNANEIEPFLFVVMIGSGWKQVFENMIENAMFVIWSYSNQGSVTHPCSNDFLPDFFLNALKWSIVKICFSDYRSDFYIQYAPISISILIYNRWTVLVSYLTISWYVLNLIFCLKNLFVWKICLFFYYLQNCDRTFTTTFWIDFFQIFLGTFVWHCYQNMSSFLENIFKRNFSDVMLEK